MINLKKQNNKYNKYTSLNFFVIKFFISKHHTSLKTPPPQPLLAYYKSWTNLKTGYMFVLNVKKFMNILYLNLKTVYSKF